jgi:hypothetical protein
MQDLAGRLIGPGDHVAYAVRRGSTTYMNIGEVVEIDGNRLRVRVLHSSSVFGGSDRTVVLTRTDRVAITRKSEDVIGPAPEPFRR